MNREQLIDALVENDIDSLTQDLNAYTIEMMLREGFVGYNHQTYEQLVEEYNNRGLGEE